MENEMPCVAGIPSDGSENRRHYEKHLEEVIERGNKRYETLSREYADLMSDYERERRLVDTLLMVIEGKR